MRALVASMVIGIGGCATSAAPAEAPAQSTRPVARSLPVPQHLPEGARRFIAQKMQGHSFEMSNLLWAVLFLDREVAGEIADTIADDPKLARPLTQDATELNSALPPLFFDLQDQLVERARHVAATAKDPAQTPDALAAEMGALTQVCVRCHSIYLYDPGAEGAGD